MKKFTKVILSLMVAFAIMFFAANTSKAANVCQKVTSNGYKPVTFTVKTGGNLLSSEKLVVKAGKGEANVYWNIPCPPKDSIGYHMSLSGRFHMNIFDKATNERIYSKVYLGDNTVPSIVMKKNKTYKVTITPAYPVTSTDDPMFSYYSLNGFRSWRSYPTWTVTKTGGNITLCY